MSASVCSFSVRRMYHNSCKVNLLNHKKSVLGAKGSQLNRRGNSCTTAFVARRSGAGFSAPRGIAAFWRQGDVHTLIVITSAGSSLLAAQIVAMGHDARPKDAKPGDRCYHFSAPELADCHQSWATLIYVLFVQLAALYRVISLGVTPDIPSRGGKVPKVAKVTVY